MFNANHAPSNGGPVRRYINPYKAWVGSFIPNWLLVRKEITSGAKLCYARLCQFYNQEKGYAWPSIPRLSEETGLSERMTRRHLDELRDAGLLESSQEGGFNRTNWYRFLWHPWMDGSIEIGGSMGTPVAPPMRPPVDDSMRPPVADKENYKQENQLRESKNTPSLSPPNPRPPSKVDESYELLVEVVGDKALLRGAPIVLSVLHERHGPETVNATIRTHSNEIRKASQPLHGLETLLREIHHVRENP